MSTTALRITTYAPTQVGSISRIKLVSQAVTGPPGAAGAGMSVATKEGGTTKVAVTTVLDFDGTNFDVTGSSGTASVVIASGQFATAAQGATADTALQPGAIGVTVQGYDADLADLAGISDVQGDIIVRGASGWERLAKSATSTDVLTAGASQPTWAAASGGSSGFIPTSTNVSGFRTFPVPGWALTSTVSFWNLTAGDWVYQPVIFDAAWSITNLAVVVQTAGSGGSKAVLAVYEADSVWQPGTLVAQTAEFAIDSTGHKIVAITASGSAGRFIFGAHPSANCNLSHRAGSGPIGPRESYLASSSDAFQVQRRIAGSYNATAPANGTDWTTVNANSYDYAFIFPYMVAT